jgi:hypothetical protein
MPVIYLTHPIHGAKVATMEAEAQADESNGWERYDPTVRVQSAAVDAAPAADENMLRVRRKRRFDAQEGA